MAGSDRLYLLKTIDGEEFGPADQETLVRWAQNGRITANCKIRSTLIARWERAAEIPFLRDIVMAHLEAQEKKNETLMMRIKRRATMKASRVDGSSSLNKARPEEYEAASFPLRLMAGLTDGVVVLVYAIAVYLSFAGLYLAGKSISEWSSVCFHLGFVVFYVGLLLYFTLWIAHKGQTIGQHFWGVIVMHPKGHQFYTGRAYLYAVALILFWFLTPFVIFISPSHRSLQELISGTRMVRVKLVGKHR